MAARKQLSFLTLFLIFVLCINMLNVQTVHADGETPTEPPVATEVETEQTAEPPVDATPVPVESTPTPVEAIPTNETIEATPTREAVTDETVPTAVVSAETLENTDIVVLDEQGQALILGSQDAANALVSSDPVWCPDSVSVPTPGANGCSVSYAGIADLLAAMQADPQSFSQNGTIFLESTNGQGFTTPLVLDDSSESLGTSFNSLNIYNLTIQGGWDPTTGSTTGQTAFSGSNAYLQVGSFINPWIGSLAINNVTVTGPGAGQDAIQIFASDVALTNVNASYSDVNGISITASEAGTVTLTNVNASNNGHMDGSDPVGSGVYISGADTLVNVTGGSFINNARYGIEALNSTSTTLPAANLWTDQQDYSPGSVVTISGNDNNLNGNNIGFLTGETVFVSVQGPNGYTATCEAIADSYGAWSCQITLWASNLAVGDYTYTATGLTSGVSVTSTFTDARTINSVTLNGGETVTVAPGGTITVVVTVTTDGGGANARWRSTDWRIGTTGGFTCVNHANHDGAGTYTETFTITAPATPGTYSITTRVYQDDGCSQGQSTSTTNGAVTVTPPDSTPPVITKVISGTSGANGWYTSNVTIDWTVTDPESSFTVIGCADTTISSETTGTTSSCSATSTGGTSNDSITIKIDKTAPSAGLSITGGTLGSNDWYTSDVTVQTSGTDSISGASCTAAQTVSTETPGVNVNGSCTNGAGLTTNASPLTVKLDKTAPVVSLSVTAGDSGNNGWYTSDVIVHTSGSESMSSPITCSPDQSQTAETVGANFNGSCTNAAGLTGNASTLNIKLDKTNPTITFAGRTAPNGNGWNNTNVTVDWSCSDSFSGPAADNVSQLVTSEGAGQSAAGNCTDLAGNTASDTQAGINIDKTDPALDLPSDITAEATSSTGAVVNYSALVTDNLDSGVTLSCAPASGSAFSMGTTPVSCSSTDQADNTTNGNFTVTVQDTTGPVIFHVDITVQATSGVGAVVDYTNPTANDVVDGPRPVPCSPASGETFPLGDTTVTCTSEDLSGNESTSTFIVHVVDTTAPTITDHADVTVEATSGTATQVDYSPPATFDAVDGNGTATCLPASGLFNFGDTTVTCNATDSEGNNAVPTSFVVHVVDTTAPVIASHADVTIEATGPGGAQVTYDVPTATDIVYDPIQVTCFPASSATFPVGNTTVTCNAMDSHLNNATPVSFTVHVVDTTDPILDLPDNIFVNATGPSGVFVTFSAIATDTVDTSVLVTCNPASGSTFPVGSNQVNCTATDNFNNQTTGSFFVNVMDPEAPTLTLPANMTVEATGPAGATVTFSATATDVVDGSVPVTCTPASGSSFPFGATTVTCEAADSNENSNEASFSVGVQDTTAPVIAPHSDFTTTTDSATGVIVNYTSPSTSDAVDGPGTGACSPASGTLFPVGDTEVTCTITDAHGNTASSSFFIHVKLSQPGSNGTTPPTTPSTSTSGLIIPLTGGERIDLECNSVIWAFGIKLSFLNLCEQQATLNSIGASDLPAELPDGFSFVIGLDVDVLSDGQALEALPDGTGIEMDFPLYEQSADQFAVLFWSEADGKWIEVSEAIDAKALSQTLSAGDGLYQVLTDSLTDLFYQILTTQKTGVFVLVKK
jgi:hypothetical protein